MRKPNGSHHPKPVVALETCPCCGHYWGTYFPEHCTRPGKDGAALGCVGRWRRCRMSGGGCGALIRPDGSHEAISDRGHAAECTDRPHPVP